MKTTIIFWRKSPLMRNTFSLRIAVLFLVISFQSTAQEKKTRDFPMSESSLLWEINGPGVKHGSYLFGTMHLIEKEYFLFPKSLEKRVQKADVLVMELPGMPSQFDAMNLLKLKQGSFFDFFTTEQSDSILVWAKEALKLSEEAFRKTISPMKPFVAIQLATQMQFMGKTASYELKFEEIATESKVEIKGLETLEEQLSFFDNLTKEQQAEMVMEGIREMEKSIEFSKKVQQVYARQNVDSLYIMLHENGGIVTSEEKLFIDDRNKKWIPQIRESLASKRIFIAVGAGHLGGPNGLIRLLEKEGYTLSPVEIK
ncbi:MAG: hypothetical protein RL679_902 [Bacteroidota bacterium]